MSTLVSTKYEERRFHHINQEQLDERLARLHKNFSEKGDQGNANKLLQLIEKLKKQELTIGFCGHFSAGKSTMINALLGENILPSNPIPTSANLVKVKSGEDYARIFYKKDAPIEVQAPYDYETIKAYCKDGDNISSVELSSSKSPLPNNVAIMDTPGMDSTDDAHRLSTESALHQADAIFYVVDYNHVQSELNFHFTKRLKNRGKKVFLVVNQIDKHDNAELDFSAFQTSVHSAFHDWGIDVDGIFYTSLMEPDHPSNQWNTLKSVLYDQTNHKEDQLIKNIFKSSEDLIADHLEFLREANGEKINKYEQQLSQLTENELHEAKNTLVSIQNSIEKNENKLGQLEQSFKSELNRIINNAQLMPPHTREMAKGYLESCQPNFKVGILFSAKKTKEEQEKRLQGLFDEFYRQVNTNLDGQVKDFIAKQLNEFDIQNDALMKAIYEDCVTFSTDLISNTVKNGATINGTTVLNYTKDLSANIKQLYKEWAINKLSVAIESLKKKVANDNAALQDTLKSWKKINDAKDGLAEIEASIHNAEAVSYQILADDTSSEDLEEAKSAVEQALSEQQTPIKRNMSELKSNDFDRQQTKDNRNATINERPEFHHTPTINGLIEQTVERMKHTINAVEELEGFKTIVNDLKTKTERLENQSFTVALFGAFSAGKSSFANALVGEKALPVSPNPTTAAINKISAPTASHPNNTAVVKLKSEDQLLNDINQALATFDKEVGQINDVFQIIDELEQNADGRQQQLSFLQAVYKGHQSLASDLGKELNVDLDAYNEFVASENKACFVEWIELYHNNPLSEQGICLVDTPGADSINARHTDVAFEYIKNADAIFFITYYNHAFTRADREFLMQLGRVKDTFAMDKMFFIVNASDLAASEEELNTVVDYVTDELIDYGIRNPRLFPVSSRQALTEKQSEQETALSGIDTFENHFYHFIENDLVQMTVHAAQSEIKRTVARLDEFIHLSQQDEEERQRRLNEMELVENNICEAIGNHETVAAENSLIQKVEDLLYHVNKRTFLKYYDSFSEFINPATIKDGEDAKASLRHQMKELTAFMGFYLAEEMRATSLRIEKHIEQKLAEIANRFEGIGQSYNNGIKLANYEPQAFTTPEFKPALKDLTIETFKATLKQYKNGKQFFERNGQKQFKDDVERQFQDPIQSYLDDQSSLIKDAYLKQMSQAVDHLKATSQEQVTAYFEGAQSALSEQVSIHKLESARAKLTQH